MTNGGNAHSRPPEDAWRRLGRLLMQRRIDVHGKDNLKEFAREHGFKGEGKVLWEIEKAKRTNFSPGMLYQIEREYGWADGSIEKVLAGGDPEERPRSAPEVKVRNELPADDLRVSVRAIINRLSEAQLERVWRFLTQEVLPEDPERPADRRRGSRR